MRSFFITTRAILLLCLSTASSYVFEFTIELQGPKSECTARDVRVILHGVEQLLDENCNEFLKYAGYSGFVDGMNLFIEDYKEKFTGNKMILGPFYGDAECQSCPPDDKDTLFFRRLNDRLSKKEVSDFVNSELEVELAGVIQSRSISDCALMADQWKATFRWL